MFGITNSLGVRAKTMRLEGQVGGVSLMVLIDSGATHKFITSEVVTALGLPVDLSKLVGVR